MVDATLQGACQCGAVRYELSGEALALYVCHCAECRKQSASAFGISLIVPRQRLHLTQGRPNFWSRTTDSGNTLECAFCATCGTRLWHQRVGNFETLSVKGGTLERALDIGNAVHIWTSRKLPGVLIPPGATQFSEEP